MALFFCIFHVLSKLNFFFDRRFPLISMQSYHQYFIALVSVRSVIQSSESHNSVNFCPILTN